MAGREIVNIDVVLPKDIAFAFGGTEYVVRGDLEVKHGLEIMRLLDSFEEAYGSGDATVLMAAAVDLENYLLPLFQERDPKLQSLPFGMTGIGKVAAVLLARIMGARDETLESMGDAVPPPKPKRPAAKKPLPRSTRQPG